MDEHEELRKVEEILRNFISSILMEKLGEDWIKKCGVTPERIAQWEERKEIEAKKLKSFGSLYDRLIYYADFYDLPTIIDKKWEYFKDALCEKKRILMFLNTLAGFRDTDAHGRELLPFQKHLLLGMSGEIISRIVVYRSKYKTADDCFPRIESVVDNYGNKFTTGSLEIMSTETILKPGYKLQFLISAVDPKGEKLEYRIMGETDWQESNSFEIEISNKHIGRKNLFRIQIRSNREHHAHKDGTDNEIWASYAVLPE